MKKYLSLLASMFILSGCTTGQEHSCDYYRTNLETPVYFEFGNANITKESQEKLNEGVVFLQKHRFRRVQLNGYADEIGGDSEFNMNLSKKRTEVVRDFLIEKGIADKRISESWHGAIKGKPYKKHRRVEIIIK